MFAENYKIVPVISDRDLTDGAVMLCDSINMSGFHKALFIVGLQTLGTANPDFTVYAAASDAGTTYKPPFKYTKGSAAAGAAGADIYAAWTSVDPGALVTLAHATDDNKTLLIEVLASDMKGYNWLTLSFEDTATAAAGNVQAHAILIPRYKGGVNVAASALV